MSNETAVYYSAEVKLSGTPDLVSNLDGSDVAVRLCECNQKHYSFLFSPTLELAVGDLVVCQVRNSFTFGIVQSISTDETLHTDYLRNVVLEEGLHKLIVSKVDWLSVKLAIRAKRLYVREKREQEKRAKLNDAAFIATMENL